jgi:biotin carboxyl carrier protein
MDLTEDDVQNILRLVDELDYGEIHITFGGLKIDLIKGDARGMPDHVVPTSASAPIAPAAAAPDEPEIPADAHVVVAPIAGTFFRAPAPGAKPFVEVGEIVAPHAPVGLLEVMKLFHSVPASVAGSVIRILAADGTAVAQGQPLIAIRPTATA